MIIHKKVKAWLDKFKPGTKFRYTLRTRTFTISFPLKISIGADFYGGRCYCVDVSTQNRMTSAVIYSYLWNWDNIEILE